MAVKADRVSRAMIGTTAAARPDVSGFVLAGGQSSRMGRDKALAHFSGRPLIAHALSILAEAGVPAAIAGAAPEVRAALSTYAPVIEDSQPGLGPLSGVCAALASTSARFAAFVSVDTPFLPPSLIGYLLCHAEITGSAVTLASVAGFAQTFPAVIDRAALLALQRELTAGRYGCFAAFEAAATSLGRRVSVLPVELLAQAGHAVHPSGLPSACWFANLNTPADAERAERLWARRVA